MSAKRTARGENALKFHAGYDVWIAGILVNIIFRGIKGLESTCQYDGAYIDLEGLLLVIKFDGVCRAEFFTGLALAFLEIDTFCRINSIFQRDGLGIRYIGCLSFGKAFVKFVNDLGGTLFSTYAAGNAFFRINVSGGFFDGYIEISLVPVDFDDFGKCKEFNVYVPADLDQFRRKNSHGTVVGGKGLV